MLRNIFWTKHKTVLINCACL